MKPPRPWPPPSSFPPSSEGEEHDSNGNDSAHHAPLNQQEQSGGVTFSTSTAAAPPPPSSTPNNSGNGRNGNSNRRRIKSRASAFSFSLRPTGSADDSVEDRTHRASRSAPDIASCDYDGDVEVGVHGAGNNGGGGNGNSNANELFSSIGSNGRVSSPPASMSLPSAMALTSSPSTNVRRSIFRGSAPSLFRKESGGEPSGLNRRASVDSSNSHAQSEASLHSSFGSTTGDRVGGLPTSNNNNNSGGVTPRPKRSTFSLPLFSKSTNDGDMIDLHNNNNNNNNNSNFGSNANAAAVVAFNNMSHNQNNSNTNGSSIGGTNTTNRTNLRSTPAATMTMKRFNANDHVLISNHGIDRINQPRRYQNLVNRYGFPLGSADAATSEERRGPYAFLLSQVKVVHFGDYSPYYTVVRKDNGEDMRADHAFMEPITNPVGIKAATDAAKKSETNDAGHFNSTRAGEGLWCLRPCTHAFQDYTRRFKLNTKRLIRKLKSQTDACMNGNRPYGFSVRVTGVNFLVVCSIWYLYIDQLRLAFMPHSADKACAIVSCIVWVVLFCELLIEVFIRPNGYSALIKSDKAYLPSTVRYLNTFHLISEMISLIFFAPEFFCLFDKNNECGHRYPFSLANACLMSLYGPDRLHAFYGTAFICILRLRIFGLVRHWTKMWINNTFVRVRGKNGEWRVQRGKGFLVPQTHRGGSGENVIAMEESINHQRTKSMKDGAEIANDNDKKNEYTDDYHLTNASKIGTALFTTNAQRGLFFVFMIGLTPLIPVAVTDYGGTNQQLKNSVELLQSNNLLLNQTNNETCDQLNLTTAQWIKSNAFEMPIEGTKRLHILSLEVEPVRCDFQKMNDKNVGTIAAISCNGTDAMKVCNHGLSTEDCTNFCKGWSKSSAERRLDYLERWVGVRPSTTVSVMKNNTGTYSLPSGEIITADFSVSVLYNEQLSVRRTIIYLFVLQLGMTLFVLLGLSVLRYDAGRLVLGPLRRMLKIVAFYAKNPLSPPPQRDGRDSTARNSFIKQNEAYYYDSDDEMTDKQLGTFETEQLINAVTKITDLLRKCWGVAGADIISSNLARQDGGLTTYFNPTVPGKAVYALFAFVSIDQFQNHLHALKAEIMILINDIAAVLHEEVFRWGYLDRGQCNKNLGGAFLMVYRIGEVSDVLEKREKAEAVIFAGQPTAKIRRRKSRRAGFNNHHRTPSIGGSSRAAGAADAAGKYSRSHVDNVDLSSLPGMRTFTDRALLGLLKTFAGIHRDKVILNWNNDFRLGAGVGAVSINLNFGMDAGWAVEGAVGSSYKIDATYLSPHVNMASRMMSATKQYGVYFLLSQAVQKLLSDNAQDKLRHIDTVTVKGSSVQQKIYTYDAKVRSDFFLYSKTEAQADLDSERYSPAIWNVDQDLVAMRNHICDAFMDIFNRGRDEYLAGNWPEAMKLLRAADKIMFEREVDEGYSGKSYGENFKSLPNLIGDDDENEERLSMGDGPCQRLIAYMEGMGGEAPDKWKGYRPLTSK